MLERFLEKARSALTLGYYDTERRDDWERISMVQAIRNAEHLAIVAEVKRASPLQGDLNRDIDVPHQIGQYAYAGAVGISVLTERAIFKGSLDFLPYARDHGLPALMKDIIIDERQIHAGADMGADCVLIIQKLFDRGLVEADPQNLIETAHERGLDVVLEVNDIPEMETALKSGADIIAINNRDLQSLQVDMATSETILKHCTAEWGEGFSADRPVMAVSGFTTHEQLVAMRELGADAFLIGSHLMTSENVSAELARLIHGEVR